MKHPILVKDDYTLYIEYGEYDGKECIFAHCDVYKWTKTVKDNIIKDVYFVASVQSLPVYTVNDPTDIKHRKFLYMVGFIPCNQVVILQDGSQKELFVWDGISLTKGF